MLSVHFGRSCLLSSSAVRSKCQGEIRHHSRVYYKILGDHNSDGKNFTDGCNFHHLTTAVYCLSVAPTIRSIQPRLGSNEHLSRLTLCRSADIGFEMNHLLIVAYPPLRITTMFARTGIELRQCGPFSQFLS